MRRRNQWKRTRRVIIALGLVSLAYIMVVTGMNSLATWREHTRPAPVSTVDTSHWTPPPCELNGTPFVSNRCYPNS